MQHKALYIRFSAPVSFRLVRTVTSAQWQPH